MERRTVSGVATPAFTVSWYQIQPLDAGLTTQSGWHSSWFVAGKECFAHQGLHEEILLLLSLMVLMLLCLGYSVYWFCCCRCLANVDGAGVAALTMMQAWDWKGRPGKHMLDVTGCEGGKTW